MASTLSCYGLPIMRHLPGAKATQLDLAVEGIRDVKRIAPDASIQDLT